MIGPIVQLIGGPCDGEQAQAAPDEHQELLFEAGDWSNGGTRFVHVYESAADGPFIYTGCRGHRPAKDVVHPHPRHRRGTNPEPA